MTECVQELKNLKEWLSVEHSSVRWNNFFGQSRFLHMIINTGSKEILETESKNLKVEKEENVYLFKKILTQLYKPRACNNGNLYRTPLCFLIQRRWFSAVFVNLLRRVFPSKWQNIIWDKIQVRQTDNVLGDGQVGGLRWKVYSRAVKNVVVWRVVMMVQHGRHLKDVILLEIEELNGVRLEKREC